MNKFKKVLKEFLSGFLKGIIFMILFFFFSFIFDISIKNQLFSLISSLSFGIFLLWGGGFFKKRK